MFMGEFKRNKAYIQKRDPIKFMKFIYKIYFAEKLFNYNILRLSHRNCPTC